jgi:hypothetical protein
MLQRYPAYKLLEELKRTYKDDGPEFSLSSEQAASEAAEITDWKED